MVRRSMDELDRAIMEALSVDARTSNRRLAAQLDVTEGTVRARIKRMEDEGQIHITALTNIDRLRNPTLVYIWIEVERSEQCDAVARELAAVPMSACCAPPAR